MKAIAIALTISIGFLTAQASLESQVGLRESVHFIDVMGKSSLLQGDRLYLIKGNKLEFKRRLTVPSPYLDVQVVQHRLYILGHDRRIYLVEVDNGNVIAKSDSLTKNDSKHLAVSNSGRRLAILRNGGRSVEIMDGQTLRFVGYRQSGSEMSSIAGTDSSNRFLLGTLSGKVLLLDLESPSIPLLGRVRDVVMGFVKTHQSNRILAIGSYGVYPVQLSSGKKLLKERTLVTDESPILSHYASNSKASVEAYIIRYPVIKPNKGSVAPAPRVELKVRVKGALIKTLPCAGGAVSVSQDGDWVYYFDKSGNFASLAIDATKLPRN